MFVSDIADSQDIPLPVPQTTAKPAESTQDDQKDDEATAVDKATDKEMD